MWYQNVYREVGNTKLTHYSGDIRTCIHISLKAFCHHFMYWFCYTLYICSIPLLLSYRAISLSTNVEHTLLHLCLYLYVYEHIKAWLHMRSIMQTIAYAGRLLGRIKQQVRKQNGRPGSYCSLGYKSFVLPFHRLPNKRKLFTKSFKKANDA